MDPSPGGDRGNVVGGDYVGTRGIVVGGDYIWEGVM